MCVEARREVSIAEQGKTFPCQPPFMQSCRAVWKWTGTGGAGGVRLVHVPHLHVHTSVMLCSRSSMRFPISSMRPMMDDDI